MASGDGRRGRSRRLVLLAAVALVVLDSLALVFRTRSTALTVGQAVDNYRKAVRHGATAGNAPTGMSAGLGGPASTTPAGAGGSPPRRLPQPGPAGPPGAAPGAPTTPRQAAAPPVAMPADGVYVYATTGYEKLSTPGAERQYPSRTTVTVSPEGPSCQSQRWEPVQEHWEDNTFCYPAPGQVTYQSTNSYVSFYGVGEQAAMTCVQPAWWRPPSQTAGTRWSYVCSGSGARYVSTGTVVGIENVVVAGVGIPAVHLHVDTTFSGSEQGSGPEDVWLDLSNSLALRMIGSVDATQNAGPFGHVQYHEEFNLSLTSTTPEQ
jgi:hypothetical protein